MRLRHHFCNANVCYGSDSRHLLQTKREAERVSSIKQVLPVEKQKEYGRLVRTPFYTPCSQGIVCYTFQVYCQAAEQPSSQRKEFPKANEMSFGGSLRSVTEGARVTLALHRFYCNALSLTRLRRELPPGGSLGFVRPECPSIFLTSTAFVGTKANYIHYLLSGLIHNFMI